MKSNQQSSDVSKNGEDPTMIHHTEKVSLDKNTMSKRKFLKISSIGFGSLIGVAALFPLYKYFASPLKLQGGSITEMDEDISTLPNGSSRMVKFGAKPVLIMRYDDGSIKAFSATCTHLACTVQYQPSEKRIFCACHGSIYDHLTGDRISGPAPKGLPQMTVETIDSKTIKILAT